MYSALFTQLGLSGGLEINRMLANAFLGAWQVLAGPGLVCSWESELLLRKGQALHRHGLCSGLFLGTATEITRLN